jgi:hypothetical protein
LTSPHDEILLQLIKGCIYKRAKIKAIQDTITLAYMLKFLRSIETTCEASKTSYKKEEGACKIEYAYKLDYKKHYYTNKSSSTSDKKCFRCGGSYPQAKECRAKEQKCNLCGKLDHFAKNCKSRKTYNSKTYNQRRDKQAQRTHQVQIVNNKQKKTESVKNNNMVMNESCDVYQVSKDDSACPRIIVDI